MTDVLKALNVCKTYDDGQQSLQVLQGVDLTVHKGERICIFGRSGSGKSTLLHILAGLLDADEGEVWMGDESVTQMTPAGRASLRNRNLGFVYQFHHLLPEFTALENVAMPLLIGGTRVREARGQAEELLERVELHERAGHLPKELSGGERLRVAVARAVAGMPKVVLADEPTGSLDTESAKQVMDLICSISEMLDTAFIIVTHDEDSVVYSHRAYRLVDGKLNELA